MKKKSKVYPIATITALSLLFAISFKTASAAKGGSNSHGGGNYFVLLEKDARNLIEEYFSQSICRNQNLDSALYHSDIASSTGSEGSTDLGRFEKNGGIHLESAMTNHWVASMSVMYTRVTNGLIPYYTLETLRSCLVNQVSN